MAVWVDGRAKPDDYYVSDKADIYGAVVSSTGSVTPADGILISSAAPPRVAVATSQVVISGNNQNAPVHLDGSASYDPQGLPLSFLWILEGKSVLGTHSILDIVLPVGTHAVTLEVSDEFASSRADHDHRLALVAHSKAEAIATSS